MKTILGTGLSCCDTDLELCARDEWLKADPQSIWLDPQSLFLSPNLGCKDLVHRKKEKRVKTILETGLSCCTVQILNCVHEMSDWKLTHNGVSITHRVSSSVLIWNAKTWSTEKRRSLWNIFWKQDFLAVLNRSWTVHKRWVTYNWPMIESALPAVSLPQS